MKPPGSMLMRPSMKRWRITSIRCHSRTAVRPGCAWPVLIRPSAIRWKQPAKSMPV